MYYVNSVVVGWFFYGRFVACACYFGLLLVGMVLLLFVLFCCCGVGL